MPRRPLTPALLALIPLLFAGCGGSGEPAPATGDEAAGGAADPAGSWVLVEAQPPIDVTPDARVTMEVLPADGGTWEVRGTSACNSYFGTVRTDGGSWDGEGYGHTEMGCDEPRMAIERAYLDALTGVSTWSRPAADELVLTGAGGELRYGALPPVATADLTATTWVLDGLISGTGPDAAVSSTVAGADEATLRLAVDGTAAASTGCRVFAGEWAERGDEIVFTTFGERGDSPNVDPDGTPTCDPAVMAQEDHVLAVLGDGFRAEIDGQRLTLTSRDGPGLSYRAAEGDVRAE